MDGASRVPTEEEPDTASRPLREISRSAPRRSVRRIVHHQLEAKRKNVAAT